MAAKLASSIVLTRLAHHLPSFPPSFSFAQSTADSSSSILVVSILLLFAVVALFVGVAWARKRMNPNEDVHGEGFTLADLRQMHKEGKLSDDEFERARAKMVEQIQAAQARRDAARAEAAKQQQQRGMT